MNHTTKGSYTILFGNREIVYTLKTAKRKTLEIAVHPGGNVTVKAPDNVEHKQLMKRIEKKACWITKQQDFFQQFSCLQNEKHYISGETHLYLGRQYRLKTQNGKKKKIKMSGGFFHVTCPGKCSPVIVKKMLDKWYREKATVHFHQRLEKCLPSFRNLVNNTPELVIRRMKRRWGSMSKHGRITLNTHLVRAPKICIDYVITHELVHTVHPNHTAEFYSLLDAKMPGWRKIRQKLESIAASIGA